MRMSQQTAYQFICNFSNMQNRLKWCILYNSIRNLETTCESVTYTIRRSSKSAVLRSMLLTLQAFVTTDGTRQVPLLCDW